MKSRKKLLKYAKKSTEKPAGKGEPKKKRSKRVNFPWLKSKSARTAKAWMAYVNDNQPVKTESKKQFFKIHLIPIVSEKSPKLFKIIKKYYLEHGRSLTKDEYHNLLYMRFICMYEKDGKPNREHPLKCKDRKFKQEYLDIVPF